MAAEQFVHLHLHSEYSLLDGLSRVDELVGRAAALEMPAVALTDHGVLYGALDFYQYAHNKGIKPIIGVEAYIAPRGMTDRTAQDRQYSHLVLLARDDEGYRSLVKLVTRSHLEGFFYRPRVDRELLAEHAGGLVALSGCPSGDVARAILRDDLDAARESASAYRDIFGPQGFWLELQSHGLLEPDESKIVRGKLQLSRELGIPVVATNDVHYTFREGAKAQDLLLCIQTNSTFDDPKRMRMDRDEFYLKSAAEMAALFAEVPEAITNTLAVAEQCNLELRFGRLNFPALSHVVPPGDEPQAHLERLCRAALAGRYPGGRQHAEERLDYELDVIAKTGFAAYILFVWDFVRWARERNILCAPRGSAAGAIVLYLLGITQVDPLEYGLTFERFLNPERVQMPDIDMDFPDDRRDEVIGYVVERYGRDHVAQIVTFGRLAARAAIRDVGRALAYPLSEVDRVAKLIPTIPIGISIGHALESTNELKQLYDSQPHVKRLVDAARSVEGVARHASTHAAGVVVAGDPLVEHVPLQKVAKSDSGVMTQYHMKALEQIGLLKMDFLGLANLTMLDKAVKNVRDDLGIELDVYALPPDDPLTYELLARGESRTVFQLEGAGMTRYLKELRPQTVHHLAALVALYRPGPMAHIPEYIARKEGRKPVEYPHPSLEPILKESYGLLVYQDQVLQVVQRVAGYSLGQADVLRRAMGKKLPEEMRRERSRFLAGAAENGYSKEIANQLWEYIEPFAGYAFNKAHAVMYAHIAYQTAYLKANFPVDWMAAVLTTEALNTERVVSVVGECRRLGITVLPPDVNRSLARFTVEEIPSARERRRVIRYGLAAIKNVGEGAVEQILVERERGGPYRSLVDFCRRQDLKTVNKRVLESLVKSGAFDDVGERAERVRLLGGLDQVMAAAQQAQKATSQGQTSLFETFGAATASGAAASPLGDPTLPEAADVSARQKLLWEKETLGLYLSSHPFQAAAAALEGVVSARIDELSPDSAGQKVVLAGVVVGVRRLTTKKGDAMLVAELEDLSGSVEVIAFPRTLEKTAELWREDAVLIVEGRLDLRDERAQVVCESARAWNEGEAPISRQQSNGEGGADRRGRPAKGAQGLDDGVAGRTAPRPSWAPPAIPPAPLDNGPAKSTAPVLSSEAPRVRLVLPMSGNHVQDITLMELVDRAVRDHPGDEPFEWLIARGKQRVRITPPGVRLAWSPELEVELRGLLGNQNVELLAPPPTAKAGPAADGAADQPASGDATAIEALAEGWDAMESGADGRDSGAEREDGGLQHVRNWWG